MNYFEITTYLPLLPIVFVFYVAKGGNFLTIKCPVTIIQNTVKQEK